MSERPAEHRRTIRTNAQKIASGQAQPLIKCADRPNADTGNDIRSYIRDLDISSSADKETIQQMQQTSSSMVPRNMEMQKGMAAQSAQIKKTQEMMKAMQA